MSGDPGKIYKKHQSFVGMRHHRPLADVKPRIETLRDRLAAAGSGGREAIVLQACEEALDLRPAPDGCEPFRLHDNSVEEISRLSDAELPRYLYYRFRYEVNPERKVLDEYPPCIQVEPTSVCNYRCVFCYQTDEELTKKSNGHMGMMSLELFKRIVDQAQGNVEAITLASRGEPLVCPDIGAMLAYASGKFLGFKMNTNASRLSEKLCHAILEADIGTLVFSADAAVEPQYSQFRVNGDLKTVLSNVERFAKIKQTQYSGSRMITRVSGVKVPGTSGLDEMEAVWGGFVDQVAFVDYNPWENTYARPVNDLKTACSDLWRRMFVWWDGRTNPCDIDYLTKLQVGDAKGDTLTGVWRSARYEAMREGHLAEKRGSFSPCDRCTVV